MLSRERSPLFASIPVRDRVSHARFGGTDWLSEALEQASGSNETNHLQRCGTATAVQQQLWIRVQFSRKEK